MAERGFERFGFIAHQYGMFSLLGVEPGVIETMRDKHHVYIVGSGRINVAGITPDNMDRLCDALADVLGD